MVYVDVNGSRKVKVGIDVGGTFTHAVAVNAYTAEVLGKAMVPTTHKAKEGVALGVVQSLQKLLASVGISPDEVSLIAHSTTQATNALLEGDVAAVGIIGMGNGALKFRIKSQENVRELELAPEKFLKTRFAFVDTVGGLRETDLRSAVDNLSSEGAEVFVATEAFGVDDPSNETRAAEIIESLGFRCTAASEISHLYGLRVRTQTAAINASMLPKMLEAADMTEASVKSNDIASRLMIMRSDGGIMSVAEMRKRPILTMLSGPAAGVAAALMYVHVFDGIFLEVGGTSTDISIIRHGRPVVRTAEIGGRRVFLRTLDVRTVGVAGGSMVRLSNGRVVDVGPRSAHIAGLKYISFSTPEELSDPQIHLIRPTSSDPADYCAISAEPGREPEYALTATDAANYLSLIGGEYARGNSEVVGRVLEKVANFYKIDSRKLATDILNKATDKVMRTVEALISDYKLDRSTLHLVGGGGAAEVIVPFTAKRLGAAFSVSRNPEVVSAIGAALGLIQETVERNILQPTEEDILKARREALDGVLRMGASADSAEVHVEVDQRNKKVVATAFGTPELRTRDLSVSSLSDVDLREAAGKNLRVPHGDVALLGETSHLHVFQATRCEKSVFGLRRRVFRPIVVVDGNGVAKLTLPRGNVTVTSAGSIFEMLPRALDEKSLYGDGGLVMPEVYLAVGAKVVDLSNLAGVNQVLALCRMELQQIPASEPIVVIISEKKI